MRVAEGIADTLAASGATTAAPAAGSSIYSASITATRVA